MPAPTDKSDPHLPHALRILARDIHCEDGIATQCLREAADEIERLRGYRDEAEAEASIASLAALRLRLTDAERAAIRRASAVAEEFHDLRLSTTLRGLLERLSPAATPEPQCTPAECSLPAEWTSRPYWVDPPSGHRYGFPRLYDPATDGDMTEWLVVNGYPEKLARQGLACTFTACTDAGEK